VENQEASYLPISMLNQLLYCPRRFWYMYVQGELEVNAPMLEGTLQHQRAHQPGRETDDYGRPVHRRVWVWSDRLQIAGFADLVAEQGGSYLPVEYKHGRQGQWDNDQVQLCAQALCLEEMTGRRISAGEIFYRKSRRRVPVPFDLALRAQAEEAVSVAHALLKAGVIPPPIEQRQKCRQCSIQPICLPDELRQLAGSIHLPGGVS